MTNTLITGGAGFIGSHVIKLFVKDKSYNVFNLDSLTYAGSLNNIEGLEKEENYTFIKGDICDKKLLSSLFKKYNFCLLYTSPSPRDLSTSRMPSSA